jgi:hypothetical protein
MLYTFVNPAYQHLTFCYFVFGVTGLRNTRRDMDMSHPPLTDDHSSVQLEPEDDELHSGPDQAARDKVIAAFLEQLEMQEQHSYTGLGDVLSRFPLPTTVDQPWLSVHYAMEADMLPRMDDEESLRFTAMAWRVLIMLPSLKKKVTVGQSNVWRAQHCLRLHHACMKHVVDFINNFCSTDSHIMCAHGKVVFLLCLWPISYSSHTYARYRCVYVGAFWIHYAWTVPVQRSLWLVCVPTGRVYAVGVPIPGLI